MKYKKLITNISNWIKDYCEDNNMSSLVIGISGGVDSAVVSNLCAITGIKTIVVSIPIRQIATQNTLSIEHGQWLSDKYENVRHEIFDMTKVFSGIENMFDKSDYDNLHSFANTRSRLRMLALYQIAGSENGLVVGTGNKVEDFGVGFYTKYGDGGVDISPIGDCMKSDVWEMAKKLEINKKIITASPTDGLWDDGRTDEDQLKGLTYKELEEAMILSKSVDKETKHNMGYWGSSVRVQKNQENILRIYQSIRKQNLHKMKEIPIFKINE